MDLSKLKEPFDPTDIEWRVQQDGVNGNGPWAMVLAYVTNRAIQNRLDDVCGPENWQNHYTAGPNGGILCGISVRVGDEWVTKWDGADNTDIEAVKGGLSDSMKRAAVQWGIGRYLYNLEATFAKITDSGRYRGYAYPTRDDKKAHRNGVKYKWDPPELPKWALPNGFTPEPKALDVTGKNEVQETSDKIKELLEQIEEKKEKAEYKSSAVAAYKNHDLKGLKALVIDIENYIKAKKTLVTEPGQEDIF